jgi:hypothetical protein
MAFRSKLVPVARMRPGEIMNRRVICCFIVLLAIPTGIVWRSLPLPFFAWKYGGSALWTVALYFSLAALLPRLRPAAIATMSALAALLVEFSRLAQQPALDAFRQTLAGRLLLGRYFSLKDIAAYWLVIVVLYFVDSRLLQPRA